MTDGLQYLPADSDFVLGADMINVSGTTFRNAVLAHFAREESTRELTALAQEAERVLFAGNSKGEKWVFVAQMKKDQEQADLDKMLRLKSSTEVDGKTVHQSARATRFTSPTAPVVVLQQFKNDKLISLFDGKYVEEGMQEQIKSVNSGTAWFVSSSPAVKTHWRIRRRTCSPPLSPWMGPRRAGGRDRQVRHRHAGDRRASI